MQKVGCKDTYSELLRVLEEAHRLRSTHLDDLFARFVAQQVDVPKLVEGRAGPDGSLSVADLCGALEAGFVCVAGLDVKEAVAALCANGCVFVPELLQRLKKFKTNASSVCGKR